MRIPTYVFLCGALVLPVAVQAKSHPEKLVGAAKPSIEAALNTPMETLVAKAIKKPAALDQVVLGLAMLAGREQPKDGQEMAYAQKVDALETRLLPVSDDYLETHPGVDFHSIDWVGVLKPTPAELLVAVYYQQRYSADYWLGTAMLRQNAPLYIGGGHVNIFGTGAGSAGTSTHFVHPTYGPSVQLQSGEYIINRPVLMTAAACVRAVRIAAGVSYQGPRGLPAVVFLMRKFPYIDIDNVLANDEARPGEDRGYISGAEACGTDAQFQTYVGMLKAAG